MGNGAISSVQATRNLWKIINNDYYDSYTLQQAQQALANGANITALNQRREYMFPTVKKKRDLNAAAGKCVDFYDHFLVMLRENASILLAKFIVDENGTNMNDIRLLTIVLGADCYQNEKYGPLGLLGMTLKKGTVTQELVELLIRNDQQVRLALGKQEGNKSCMDYAKATNKMDVIDYLQLELNKLLNKMPFERDISIEEIYSWAINGADTEWKDENDETVLCKAVDANRLDLCEALVAAGANTSCQNKDQQTLVQIVRSKRPINQKLIKVLESRTIIDRLKSAIINHDSVDDIQAILSQGVDINSITNAHQDTCLHLLIQNNGSVDMMKMFVNDYKADINAMNIKGHRAMETAIVSENDEETTCAILMIFFRLKQFTTDLFYNEKLKQSLLTFCDNQKQKLTVRKLIQTELNQRLYQLCQSSNDETEADEEKDKEICQELVKLVQYGAQIDHQQPNENYGSWTIVHLLCKLGKLNLLKYVIETLKATTYHEKTESNDYPISIAAEWGHLSIVHYLRESFDRVNLNVANSNGDTPLHQAVKNNHFLIVRYLVQWGADPLVKNNLQQIPVALVTLSENNKPMIIFLEQFNDIPDEQTEQARPHSAHLFNDDFDFCHLVIPVVLDRIDPNFDTAPESNRSPGLLEESPNQKLFRAAGNGDPHAAKDAIALQADVCYLNGRYSSYAIALKELRTCENELKKTGERHRRNECILKINQYNKLVQYLTEIATAKMKEAIKQGNAGWTMAYHQCGATITPDLLVLACQHAKDCKEIVDYLITNSPQTYQSMFNFDPEKESPYSIALKKKYTNIADYIQWRLTEKLTDAVNKNDTTLVQQLLHAGASADMQGQKHLDQAIQKNNVAMVHVLCEHGARFPSSTVTIDNPQIKSILKRYELNYQFRKATASGKLANVIHYHRQSADINAKNCHGATALLITLQSGEYYSIVYYLVSCGASMLHSDVTQPSVIDLAEKRKYQQIFAYLSKQLNTQFLLTIIDDDTSTTEALAQLGTDFNCTDEEGRTPLHYAVQYHGAKLIKWLCDRGSNPMKADNHGNYPITQAAENGNYAIIEYFIGEYPATKQLRNKQGFDALAIVKRKRFNEIVQLFDPGNPDFLVTKKSKKITKPKYTNERLDRAVRKSEIPVIQEFIDQEYQSLETKKEQCKRMMDIANEEKNYQILAMLQTHYAELTQELTSKQTADRLIGLGEIQREIFYGFMSSLTDLITGGYVKLDPADPKTYDELLSSMISRDEKRSEIIRSIRSSEDSEQLCEQELNKMQEKIENLNKNLDQMKLEKQKSTEKIHDLEKQLNDKNVSAIQKKEYFNDKKAIENALNALESSIQLSRHAHETAQNKRKLLDYIKTNPKLFVFYTTIENRLQSLFNGVLAAQSGLIKTELSTKVAKLGTVLINNAPLELVPVAGAIMSPIKNATKWLVETLDKRHQKAEWYNISVLGNIQELQKAASTTAGFLTVYYNEQIQLIDTTSSKVQGSNIFSTAVSTINTFIEGTPEPENERTIVLVAEFLAELIIDILKLQDRKEKNKKKEYDNQILPDKPLAEQLWLFIAQANLLKLSKLNSLLGTTGFGLAKRMILIHKRIDGKALHVQVRQLFGYVSLITGHGHVYRIENDADEQVKFDDIEGIFGYVYLDPFIADDTTIIDKICEKRNLTKLINNNVDKAISLANEKMIEGVRTLKEVPIESGNSEGITKRMAFSVGKVLQDEKVFLTKDEVDNKLNQHQVSISYDVNSLREETKDSIRTFQTSIDAAYEKIGKDFDDCRRKVQRDSQEQYQISVQKLSDQQKQLEEYLEKSNAARLNKIDNEMKKKSDDMMAIAINAQQESQVAVRTSKNAEDFSMKCEQNARVASEKAEALVASTEQRKQQMERAIHDSRNEIRRTIAEQKQAYQTSLDELQSQIKSDLEILRTETIEAKQRADEAEKRATNVAQQMKQLVNNQKKEMDELIRQQREGTDRLIRKQEEKMSQLIKIQERKRKVLFNNIIKIFENLVKVYYQLTLIHSEVTFYSYSLILRFTLTKVKHILGRIVDSSI